MKKALFSILVMLTVLNAQALFEVKDTSDHSVFEISDDGIRIFNFPDTLMVISSSEIKAYISNSKDRALSRSFSVTTSASKGPNVLEVTSADATMHSLAVTPENATMSSTAKGPQFSYFSPENIFLGLSAGAATVPSGGLDGKDNVFIGNYAGITNYNGRQNIFIGKNAGYTNYTGDGCTIIGYDAGYKNTGNNNVFVGNGSGYNNGSYGLNTYLGNSTAYSQTTGGGNVYLGNAAGMYKTGGSNNTLVGTFSGGFNSTGTGNVFIGYYAGYTETGSDLLYIANSSTNPPLIYGNFSTGRVGLGTTSLSYRLEVQDNVVGPMARFKNLGNNYSRHGIRIDAGEYALGGDHWLIRCFTGDGSLYAGSIKSNNGIMSFDSPSDIRLKKNISTSNFNALKMLMNLRIVDYQWKTSKDSDEYARGYIAQEAQEVLPEMVSTNPDTGYLGISNSYLIPVLHKAIQEQQEYIEKLESRLERIEKLLNK